MKSVTSWGELVGPVVREESVPEDIRLQPGLISCTTKQGTVIYPIKQFTVENGGKVPSPEMQKAVLLLSAERAAGTGLSDWANAGLLLGTPQAELQGATFADILTDSTADEGDKYRALGMLLMSISRGFEHSGIDSDKVWQFVFARDEPN